MDIDEAIRILRTLPVSTVYESAGKVGDVAPSIRAMAPGMRLAGRAFTLKTMPGDNLSVFRAIHEAPAGCVLVIDGGDTERVTIWGGTSTTAAQAKGLAGCVTNASVRDLDEILESGFPVFAPRDEHSRHREEPPRMDRRPGCHRRGHRASGRHRAWRL